jgi:peptidoglycan hydrolase CwlO-like protein
LTQPKTGRSPLADARFRRRRLALGAALAVSIAIAAASLASGADPSLEEKIDSARSQSEQLSDQVEAQAGRVAELQQQARAAGVEAMQLQAEIERTTERQHQLAADLSAAEQELSELRGRYRRAVKILSERVVEIYKSPTPDGLSVVLDAAGWEDLSSRADYLDALNDADSALADRVAELRAQVKARYERVAALKAEIDQRAAQLGDAQASFAVAEAAAEAAAGQVSGALAEDRSNLSAVEGRVAALEAEQEEQAEQLRQQQLEQLQQAQEQEQDEEQGGGSSGTAFLGGPYAIPTYIVICESGGNYSALNPSSGAGGAYQILPSTWHTYGGSGLPHQASKAEQDRIAALIWADAGPSAWACA